MSEARIIRVLLIEDDEDDFVLTRELLADSRRTRFALDWVPQFDEGLEAIARDEHDVILVDYRLGTHDGLEVLQEAKRAGCGKPIILLTGQGDGDVDIAAMKAGAADYLVKGQIDAQILERAIRYSLEQSRTLEALRESEERYALSARGANDGLWVWDLRADCVYYSTRWKSMLGYGEDEVGESVDDWFSRVHPDDVEMLRAAVELHRRGETSSIEHEHRMRCKDGEHRWMLTRGLAERDASGAATRIAGSQTDITERKLAVERLTHDAFHDALTQLPNRALFMDRLDRSLERSRREPEHLFAVLFLDLDRFKVVNDSLGHVIGDRLLIGVAERLRRVIRSTDTVARLGGDEFTILLDSIEHVADALRTAKRLQEELALPFKLGDHEIFTTASIGIALSATGYERAEDVLRDADIAMYRAKSEGRARHEVFDKTMHDRAVHLLRFETDLRRAIERNELRLLYQPIVSLVTGRVTGFEALVRWQRGDELVAATEIIPIAEENGLILPIGQWVLREALRQLAEWNVGQTNGNALQMHVNLSAKQLLQPNLLEQIENELRESGVDPHRLHLEITESVLIENAEAAALLLQRLRGMKVRISLDDFGTGYSSLSSLRLFPIDTLKIDRSFIATNGNSDGHHLDDEIVRTISNLARILGMDVTVEGLESREQVGRMRSLGIDQAQGFFFSPPVDAPEAVAFVAASRASANVVEPD
jgi:diguanylate cyclase (GGDEF)-like protein/PAS domain S-box-containing protein